MTLTISPQTVHEHITKEEFYRIDQDDQRAREIELLVNLLLPLKVEEGIKFLIDDSERTVPIWKKRLNSVARIIRHKHRDSGLKEEFNYTNKVTQDGQGNFWFNVLREA